VRYPFCVVFRVLADATVVVHLAFVVFALLGGLLVLRWPQVAWVHLPAAAWGAWVEFAGCSPAHPRENWLREQGDRVVYSSSFIEHYLLPILYPASLSRELQWTLGGIVVLVNIAVYMVVLGRRTRR
jgi:hypothetical protein